MEGENGHSTTPKIISLNSANSLEMMIHLTMDELLGHCPSNEEAYLLQQWLHFPKNMLSANRLIEVPLSIFDEIISRHVGATLSSIDQATPSLALRLDLPLPEMSVVAPTLSTIRATSFTSVTIQETLVCFPSSTHHNSNKSKKNKSSHPKGDVKGDLNCFSIPPGSSPSKGELLFWKV